MDIPQDPVILLSYLNTQLRDYYPNLNELCQALGLDELDIKSRLEKINYEYDPACNRFV